MSANNIPTSNPTPESKLMNRFLACASCGQKSISIEESNYCLPYNLHDNEVYLCESCKTSFVLYYGDNYEVEKQQISFNCLFNKNNIPF